MSVDQRVRDVDGFTKTQHKSVPPALDPSTVRLPDSFTVCIIGASTGIGEHIAYSFARARAGSIVIASRTPRDLEMVAEEIHRIHPGGNLSARTCDVSKASDVEALADFVKSEYGRLDVLILNAGYAGNVVTKMHQGEPVWVQKAFEINTIGTYLAAHYFVPLLVQSEDGAKAFFAIGSIAGCIRRGVIANTGYTYAEEGLVSLAIHPGAVLTRMARGNTPEEFLSYLTDEVDLCGAVCVYLCRHIKDLSWLSGRLISATWDMEELMSKKTKVVGKDLLKLVLVTE